MLNDKAPVCENHSGYDQALDKMIEALWERDGSGLEFETIKSEYSATSASCLEAIGTKRSTLPGMARLRAEWLERFLSEVHRLGIRVG